MSDALLAARAAGFEARQINYPVKTNPIKAWRVVRDAALRARRQQRQVYAYGESAGGILTALLAEHGLVAAAVDNSGPGNFEAWGDRFGSRFFADYWAQMGDPGRNTLDFLSPSLHSATNPILVEQTSGDVLVPWEMNRRWADRDPKVYYSPFPASVSRLDGGHVVGPDYSVNLATAFGFIQRASRETRRTPGATVRLSASLERLAN